MMVARTGSGPVSRYDSPAHRGASVERHDRAVAERVFGRYGPCLARERDGVAVARQPVEVRAVKAREPFEAIERAGGLERLRVELERGVRRVATGATARRLLCSPDVRRGIGAEKELRIAARRGFDQRFAVRLALEHGQAIAMRAQTAGEERVARIGEVLRRD